MIIVVSDVHLGHERCNRDNFTDFVRYLTEEDFDYLVLLCDVIDFLRRDALTVLSEIQDILSELAEINAKKYYVLGNHDYTLPGTKARNLEFTFRKTLTLESGCKTFRLIHGYQIEFRPVLRFYQGICRILCSSGDSTGKILNDAWDFYQHKIRKVLPQKSVYSDHLQNLTREELNEIVTYILKYPEDKPPGYTERFFSRQAVAEYRKSVNINPDDTLVFGHTHSPFVAESAAAANPGCWVSGAFLENSYLTIEDGRVELNCWNGRDTEALCINYPGDGFSQSRMEVAA